MSLEIEDGEIADAIKMVKKECVGVSDMTAFEINQESIVRLASARQRYICQAQSLNLFFPADESEEVISAVHKLAFKDKYIKSLYYIRSEAGVQGSTGECVVCEG